MTQLMDPPANLPARQSGSRATVPQTSLTRVNGEVLAQMEQIVTECQLVQSQAGRFMQAFAMAGAIKQMKALISNEMMADVMQLQGTSLGFRTDKDRDGGYQSHVVKECAMEAVLRGARLVGNEFNIISGRTYLTKEFFCRAVGELDGVSDVRICPGVPKVNGGEALIRFNVFWKQDGQTRSLTDGDGNPGRVFVVKVNSGMGADAIIGKATRKALKAVYEQVTGSISLPDGEVDDAAGTAGGRGGSSAERLQAKLTKRPVSEGQTLETDDGQIISGDTAEEQPAQDAAPEPGEPDTAGAQAEPPSDPVEPAAAPDARLTHGSWMADCEAIGAEVGMTPQFVQGGMHRYLKKLGKLAAKESVTDRERETAEEAIRAKAGYWAM